MKKYGGMIVVGLLALCIGLVLAVQVSTTAGTEQGGLVPLAKLKGYEVALKQIQDEKEAAVAELMELESRLAAIEKETADEDVLISGLVMDIEKYRMAAGLLDVKGPGVLVTIKDPVITDEYLDDVSVITYRSELLLELVNKMKEAGAEAISINEQRIVQTTEISLAGDNININGSATAPPYYVKAIGNPDTLSNALSIRSGIIETMKKKNNLTVDIETKDEIVIPRYTGTIGFKFAQPVSTDQEE